MNRNEGRACDAALRLLEARCGEVRSDVRRPEKDGLGPQVDLRAWVGLQEYAFEHTLIEPHEGATRAGKLSGELMGPVRREVQGRLPGPAHFQLYLPLDPSLGVPRSELVPCQRALVDWILTEAGPLHRRAVAAMQHARFPRSLQASVEAQLPGFPYTVTMWCGVRRVRDGREDGQFLDGRLVPDTAELESMRTARLRRTLSDKCPKLWQCKDEGARTVLVLESSDIFISNHALVRDALAGPLRDRPDAPDEVFLVETEIDPWIVYPLKFGAESGSDFDAKLLFEVRVAELDDFLDVS